jgi:hypothetical protein
VFSESEIIERYNSMKPWTLKLLEVYLLIKNMKL